MTDAIVRFPRKKDT